MIIKNTIPSLTLILIVFASTSSFADTSRLGVENIRYYPQYTTINDQYEGYAAEVFKLFSRHSQHQFDFQPLPVKRLYRFFFEGEVDFKYPDNPYWGFSEERKKTLVTYSEPVVDYIDGCMVLRENLGKGKNSIKVLGTMRGFTPFEYLDDIKAGNIELSENSSFAGLLRQALRKRIDCAYINIAVARYQLNTVLKKPEQLAFDPDLPHTRSSYSLASIKRPDVIAEFNRFMKVKADAIKLLRDKFDVGIE